MSRNPLNPLITTLRPVLRPRPLVSSVGGAPFMNIPIAVGTAVVGVGIYAMYTTKNSSSGAGASQASGKPVFSSFGFRSLKVHSTELINHNTKRIRFELPDPNQPSGLALTSAVLTFSFPGGGWIPCVRPYTPTNDLNEPGFLELTVKHYPGGKQSTHIHSLKVGDTLTMAPLKEFSWTANKHDHVALIAGGAGITPMWQLAQGILNNPEDKTKVSLVWGVNSDEDIFLKDEFAALEKKYPGRFSTTYVVSKPKAGSPYQQGYITQQLLESVGLRADEKNKDTKVFVCGPPAMEKAVFGSKGWIGSSTGVLSALGYTSAQIHKF